MLFGLDCCVPDLDTPMHVPSGNALHHNNNTNSCVKTTTWLFVQWYVPLIMQGSLVNMVILVYLATTYSFHSPLYSSCRTYLTKYPELFGTRLIPFCRVCSIPSCRVVHFYLSVPLTKSFPFPWVEGFWKVLTILLDMVIMVRSFSIVQQKDHLWLLKTRQHTNIIKQGQWLVACQWGVQLVYCAC